MPNPLARLHSRSARRKRTWVPPPRTDQQFVSHNPPALRSDQPNPCKTIPPLVLRHPIRRKTKRLICRLHVRKDVPPRRGWRFDRARATARARARRTAKWRANISHETRCRQSATRRKKGSRAFGPDAVRGLLQVKKYSNVNPVPGSIAHKGVIFIRGSFFGEKR